MPYIYYRYTLRYIICDYHFVLCMYVHTIYQEGFESYSKNAVETFLRGGP